PRDRNGIVDLRSRTGVDAPKPVFNNLKIETLFEDIYFIMSTQSSNPPQGVIINGINIKQMDNVVVGLLGGPVSLINSAGNKNIVVSDIVAHDICQLKLMEGDVGTSNIL